MSLSLQSASTAGSSIAALADRAGSLESAKPFAKELQALDTLLTQLVQRLKQDQTNGPAAGASDNHCKTCHNDNDAKPATDAASQKSAESSASHGSSSTADTAQAAAAGGASALTSGTANDSFLTELIALLEQLLAKLEAEEAAAGNHQGQGAAAQGQSGGAGGAGGGDSGGVSSGGGSTAKVGDMSAKTYANKTSATDAAGGAREAGEAKGGGKVAGSSDTDELKSMGKVTGFKTADYGPDLAKNKKEILSSLEKAGATDDEKAMVISMFMVETTMMNADQRDMSKDDKTDGSRNFSSLNLNESMLGGGFGNEKEGVKTYQSGVDLNDPANIGQAAVACLEGMRLHGAGAWLAGQRGGGPAATRHSDIGTAITNKKNKEIFENFYSSVLTGMEAMKKDPALLTDSRRVEPDVVGVYLGPSGAAI
ncbi:MAG: hypothetical protein V4695_00015 [Pseudomonadota bacterium]